MSWIEIRLIIPPQKLEDISAYLFAMGCEGVHLHEQEVIVYFSTYNWSDEIRKGLSEFIGQIIPGFDRRYMQVKSVSEFDWSSDWKKHFKPLRITNSIVVLPPWEEYPLRADDIKIVINPQMAFGTGQHESTQLMITALVKNLKPGMHVLDVGTGSGILAIIADKLGAQSVTAIDFDGDALKNALENAGLNNVSTGLQLALATLEQLAPREFDLILANINRNVILKYAALFPGYLRAGAKLILSGFLLTDDLTVVQQYRQKGYRLISKHVKKEWLALVFEFKAKSR